MTSPQQNLFAIDPEPWELDSAGEALVAEVVVADAPTGPYSYRVPGELARDVEPGRRVWIPLGRGNRKRIGYVVALETKRLTGRPLKEIASVIDRRSLLSPAMLKLTRWMADHYLCRWSSVLDGVLPSGVRTDKGTREVTLLSVPAKVAARIASLQLPAKQHTALATLAASPQPLTTAQLAAKAGCTSGPIKALIGKGLVEPTRRRVFDHDSASEAVPREPGKDLSPQQQTALAAIHAALEAPRHETFLIRGVTGSGKTEVYIQAIERAVSFNRQAIVLVPEISLTPQTVGRFRARFDRVAVLHSHLSDADRHAHWRAIADGAVQVVVGARSAVFAPAPRLGLIALDEEHEGSFKQDSAPRYHARDVALFRAKEEGVPLVLGSATPALESFHKALTGEYTLLNMPQRIFGRPLPAVRTLDLRGEFRSRQSRGAISRQLHQAITEALRENGQVMLLLNRRGFSTHIQCPACGQAVRCPHCDLTLTYHRHGERARCHFCDYDAPAPTVCGACDFGGLQFRGLGTQRLEAEARARFKEARILRMDSDTMQGRGAHEAALTKFKNGEIDILLGTQMIAKGLDFPNVTLVGVVNADVALHLPDFRAAERTFQLVTQVAGRTGRSERGGRVLVQTFAPESPAIDAATTHDFEKFARMELDNRRRFGYPPFGSLIRVIARGPQEETTAAFLDAFAKASAERLKSDCGEVDMRLLGPAPAPIAKHLGKYRYHFLLLAKDAAALRESVRKSSEGVTCPDGVQWIADVDPLDMM